ncbi:unnamed protein product [Nesidiocoris tenuis]|uniref:Uncharacterized protein n=1 Tax=Nesidiocoris tenuis TaxID=355587 RepID=A0A6H5G1H1_9HEMI|nr:unnamed protein product [Nesidiocoris tenuis]
MRYSRECLMTPLSQRFISEIVMMGSKEGWLLQDLSFCLSSVWTVVSVFGMWTIFEERGLRNLGAWWSSLRNRMQPRSEFGTMKYEGLQLSCDRQTCISKTSSTEN